MRGRFFVVVVFVMSPTSLPPTTYMLGKAFQPIATPLSRSRLTLIEASPGTSGENLAECRDTKSLSSWSKLHSIRFVSHDRIPVEEKEDSWQASSEAPPSRLGKHPYKGFSCLFLESPLTSNGCPQMEKERSLHWDTGQRTDSGAEVLPFIKHKCSTAGGCKENSY